MIVYEKEPERAANAAPQDAAPAEQPPAGPPGKERRKRIVGIVPVQAAVCGLLLAALLFLRALAPDAFRAVRDYVAHEMARSVLISENDL